MSSCNGSFGFPCDGYYRGTERWWSWRKFRFVDVEVEYIFWRISG
jgi:hypothetical protein